MAQRKWQTRPVDAASMHEWEADAASQVGAALLFWCWYLPCDVMRASIRARALLRYPLYTPPVKQNAARALIRSR
jgi:hypothetical protein